MTKNYFISDSILKEFPHILRLSELFYSTTKKNYCFFGFVLKGISFIYTLIFLTQSYFSWIRFLYSLNKRRAWRDARGEPRQEIQKTETRKREGKEIEKERKKKKNKEMRFHRKY